MVSDSIAVAAEAERNQWRRSKRADNVMVVRRFVDQKVKTLPLVIGFGQLESSENTACAQKHHSNPMASLTVGPAAAIYRRTGRGSLLYLWLRHFLLSLPF
jgi:hypothetical protein